MRHTNATIAVKNEEDDGFVTFVIGFQLHHEDYDLALDCVDFLNAHSKEEWAKHGIKEPMDLADFFLNCITHEIHSLISSIRGTEFVLRMDRKKPSC